MKALSIRQPWATLIIHFGKDFENRTWATNYRGPFYVHAAKGMTNREFDEAMAFVDRAFPLQEHQMRDRRIKCYGAPRGGIIGHAEITGCVRDALGGGASPWFMGPVGLALSNPQELPFLECKGQLGFFNCDAVWDKMTGRTG